MQSYQKHVAKKSYLKVNKHISWESLGEETESRATDILVLTPIFVVRAARSPIGN